MPDNKTGYTVVDRIDLPRYGCRARVTVSEEAVLFTSGGFLHLWESGEFERIRSCEIFETPIGLIDDKAVTETNQGMTFDTSFTIYSIESGKVIENFPTHQDDWVIPNCALGKSKIAITMDEKLVINNPYGDILTSFSETVYPVSWTKSGKLCVVCIEDDKGEFLSTLGEDWYKSSDHVSYRLLDVSKGQLEETIFSCCLLEGRNQEFDSYRLLGADEDVLYFRDDSDMDKVYSVSMENGKKNLVESFSKRETEESGELPHSNRLNDVSGEILRMTSASNRTYLSDFDGNVLDIPHNSIEGGFVMEELPVKWVSSNVAITGREYSTCFVLCYPNSSIGCFSYLYPLLDDLDCEVFFVTGEPLSEIGDEDTSSVVSSVSEVIDELEDFEKVYSVGHSAGGSIALEVYDSFDEITGAVVHNGFMNKEKISSLNGDCVCICGTLDGGLMDAQMLKGEDVADVHLLTMEHIPYSGEMRVVVRDVFSDLC